MYASTAAREERIRRLAESLPEVSVTITGERRQKFLIGSKPFAYLLNDHHGDGIVGLACKSTFEEQDFLLRQAPDRYYRPAYLGAHGWVALRIDQSAMDWTEVEDLLRRAYRLAAPKRLAAQVQPIPSPD